MERTPASTLIAAARTLAASLDALRFAPPVSHVYNPLIYARIAHEAYLAQYAGSRRRIVFLGMNPGPFGMVQTGVPFGEISIVRDWLGIEAAVDKPACENPKRPIEGFACTRSEVSGQRLWGLFRDRFGTADAFFTEHFVANYCPLAFFDHGRNLTPDKLPAGEMRPVEAACDQHLRTLVTALEAEWVIGIGAFAEAQARRALQDMEIRIGRILHPSPASPAANRGWAPQAEAQLRALGLW